VDEIFKICNETLKACSKITNEQQESFNKKKKKQEAAELAQSLP
jgi:hypothetical protein